MTGASDTITAEVTAWPGVSPTEGRFGAHAFRVGTHEVGHLHGDHALHLAFPKRIWADLHDQGRIDFHPVFPGKPGPASRRLDDEDDVREAIALLRLSYERIVARYGLPAAA